MLSDPVILVTWVELTERKRYECRGFVDELSRHWTFDQPFGHEPAVGPEGSRERGEIPGVTLDSEEVDRRRIPFWDVAESSRGLDVSRCVCGKGEPKRSWFDVLRS
jgi:hypothetical protein